MTFSSSISAFGCGHTQHLASQQEISFESGATGGTYVTPSTTTSIIADRKKGKVLEESGKWHPEFNGTCL